MKNLDTMTTEELGKLFPVYLVDYCPGWPLTFLNEKRELSALLSFVPNLKIDHIGSTAIPGLASKPIIDMLVQVDQNTSTDEIIIVLKAEGYHYIPRPDKPAPQMMFVKGYTEDGFQGQGFHLHIRYHGNWPEICFRDYLIKHPEAASQYEQLKRELSVKHKFNREKYTEGKTSFVISVCQESMAENKILHEHQQKTNLQK
jgi:GrpB-like predicted nucleotidyltransferase (UPF0157 family)